jgi:hypothetical protein
MEKNIDSKQNFDGALFAYNKHEVLKAMGALKEPSTVLFVEPAKNEYWIFYYGGLNNPLSGIGLKNIDFATVERKKGNPVKTEVAGKFRVDSIIVDELFIYSFYDVVEKVKDIDSMRVSVEVAADGSRTVHVFSEN